MIGLHIGIDLGSSVIKVYQKGRGVVFSEPSVLVCDAHTGKPVAFGSDAAYMLGRTPGSLKVVYPVNDGAIGNFEMTVYMLSYYIEKLCHNKLYKPNVIVSLHGNLTELEKRTVLDVVNDTDVARAFLIEEPLAAALGAGIGLEKPRGMFIVDIGGGTCDSAVVTMGSIAVSNSIKVAGITLSDAIKQYVLKTYNIEIGFHTAQEIKHLIGGSVIREPELAIISNGKNHTTGIPLSFELTSTEIYWALKEHVDLIISSIHELIEKTPPEFMSDISDNGILLTGGGARLYGMDICVSHRLSIPAKIAENPEHCVIDGLGKALKDMERLFRSGHLYNFKSLSK